MKKRILIIFYVLLGLLSFLIIGAVVRWIKAPPELRANDPRADAMKMSGVKFEVVSGEEGKISTEFAIFDPITKNWFPLVPCTAEQQQLKLGDSVTFHYRDEELNTTAKPMDEPMAEKFCHLQIIK